VAKQLFTAGSSGGSSGGSHVKKYCGGTREFRRSRRPVEGGTAGDSDNAPFARPPFIPRHAHRMPQPTNKPVGRKVWCARMHALG
jgi:hypothetical protein